MGWRSTIVAGDGFAFGAGVEGGCGYVSAEGRGGEYRRSRRVDRMSNRVLYTIGIVSLILRLWRLEVYRIWIR